MVNLVRLLGKEGTKEIFCFSYVEMIFIWDKIGSFRIIKFEKLLLTWIVVVVYIVMEKFD